MRKSLIKIITIISLLIIAVVFVSGTYFVKNSDFYIGGSGEEQILNVIDSLKSGNRLIIVEKNDDVNFDYLIDRVYDDSHLFWIAMQYNAVSIGDVDILYVREKYTNLDLTQRAIDSEANEIINAIITDEMSEYDKVKAIHDWICANIVYAEANDTSDQDVYGALVKRKARCAGYAKAFTYLLEKVNVESYVISGDAIDKDGNSVAHAWNLVYIDGKPYYFDVTWDDDDFDRYTYDYFAMTSKEFKLSHFPSQGYYYVDADSTDASYYIKNGMYLHEYDPMAIAAQILRQGKNFSIKCKNIDIVNEVLDALNSKEELIQIMRWAGIYSIERITYKYNQNANCIHINIVAKDGVSQWG